jgi:hypothetical protein
MLVAD